MSLQVHVISAPWAEFKDALQQIRRVVFVEEQNVSQEEEWDGQDEDSRHFLAVTELGQYIGCARLLPTGQIGRMAVLQDQRGTGVGALLLEAAVEDAKSLGFEKVFLHAQSYAENFYRKGGFVPYGPEFLEAGIAHIAMEMKLPLPFSSVLNENSAAVVAARTSEMPLERKHELPLPASQPESFTGQQALVQELDLLVGSAKRKLDLLHPTLDHELFERDTFVQLVSDLARSAPGVEIRILIMNSKLIVDRGHKLVELARRLDEKIAIRLLDERISDETSAFACADQTGYWLQPSWREPQGVRDLNNRVTTTRFVDTFNQAWVKSTTDPQLRLLKL